MDYIIHIIIIILIYIQLTNSLILTSGYANMISLVHAGFYGIGAYTSSILAINFGFPILLSMFSAMLITGMISLFVSTIALRTVDDYFIIITLGVQVVILSILNNWSALTNGPMGISGIPSISIFGFIFQSKISYLILTLIFSTLVFAFVRNIIKSPFGRVLIGLSNDEIFTKSLGKKVYSSKIICFTISGMLAAIPGVIYAHYFGYIDPSSFNINESIFVLSLVIIGGIRNLKGAIIASIILIVIPEILRFIGMPSNIAANMRQIIYGLALVIMMFKYSKGFISKEYVGQENKF